MSCMSRLAGEYLSLMERLGRTHLASASEPIVGDAPSVARQVFKSVQAVEVIDWDLCDCAWFGQAQIDCDATLPLFIDLLASPKRNAPTDLAKVELNCFASCK